MSCCVTLQQKVIFFLREGTGLISILLKTIKIVVGVLLHLRSSINKKIQVHKETLKKLSINDVFHRGMSSIKACNS